MLLRVLLAASAVVLFVVAVVCQTRRVAAGRDPGRHWDVCYPLAVLCAVLAFNMP